MSKWLQAAKSHATPPDKTDLTDKTSAACSEDASDNEHNGVLSVLSVLSDGPPADTGHAMHSPARDLLKSLQSDMDLYAEALRLHGPMSYGQAMDVLGWGATRTGSAETDLRKAKRIEFNKLGRAVLVDREGVSG